MGLVLALMCLLSLGGQAQNVYTQRFLDLRAKMNDPANGYFSKDGVPYHSVETLMCEAPDHGHETTSEAYSYWIWMEAMYGGISGDWSSLNSAWEKMEATAIPTSAMQPTVGDYDPSDPADYAEEYDLPDYYPAKIDANVPVGEDPVSNELKAAYGKDIYAMHWLFDCDNFYGYGNMGDGTSTPSYINTFQRGCQESVWETVPHPSWEAFKWGQKDNGGFLPLFAGHGNYTKQWRYTNAPDADARAVQAMYWAVQFAKEQQKDPKSVLPVDKAAKMGDFIRLAMFDKYFKKIGCENAWDQGGKGYESAHYLLSWYFAWGGPLTSNNWSFRIGASHSHFGYQNPVAAYALSQTEELKPVTQNGARDWGKSMQRQLELYTWLQSANGAIAGGVSNSVNGRYEAHPAGVSTFYGMVYEEHPVYHDPGSNQWFGMQAWSMERIAELYYIDNNEMAKNLLEKWVAWVKSEVKLTADGDYEIPATLKWTGQPDTWVPGSKTSNNTGLTVEVLDYSHDAGIAGCLAKALTYYAAATQKYGTLDDDARELAKQLLDRMWTKYYDADGLGVTVTEKRSDYKRFFEQEVYVPDGYEGEMPNGDKIKKGVKFHELRTEYKNDPMYADLKAAYDAGEDYEVAYHRYWAQADIALANAEYGRFFGDDEGGATPVEGVELSEEEITIFVGETKDLKAVITPIYAKNKKVTWTVEDAAVASVDNFGTVTGVAVGSTKVTVKTVDGGFTDTCIVNVKKVVGAGGSADNKYTNRFLELRKKMNDPANGYFSKDGVPYHSVETLMCEAPDHGHETTSEAYSYWIWMEAMYGGISGDWSSLQSAWKKMEATAIPTKEMQPTASDYNSADPADYAGEYELPDYYPAAISSQVPVGEDPVSDELTNAYGDEIYAMHWLFDCDNFYGYGNMGDGTSTPSYINTFQRGCQESVWETVPHPSWEAFKWGQKDGGFLPLFAGHGNYAKQWRYTNAPDADARAVQAMYWAVQFAKAQGKDPKSVLPLEETKKMGDFVRLAMFDKYFKPLGCQDKNAPGGRGYESAHYLLSWYFAWGGPLTQQNWAWRIGCSHSHFGYQNPVAAYALSQVNELKPITPNGARDWGKSMQRQLELYTWLQSAEGAIAGGVTNSVNGRYDKHPAGAATFYGMVYDEHPVYHDPGSNQWFGMQAWSMERIAELYYIDNNEMAKNLLDKWVAWVKSEVKFTADGDYQIPATLKWTGQPDTWKEGSKTSNNQGLHVRVADYSHDAGIAGCLAKALTYYAAATQRYGTLDDEARQLAQDLLDSMWDKYYDANGLGVTVVEKRADYKRFFEQEVFVPDGYEGVMPNGDKIKKGVKFYELRTNYMNDPMYADLKAAYDAGKDYEVAYHRYWAQADIALANAEYGRFFGADDESEPVAVEGVEVTPAALTVKVGDTEKLTASVTPTNATNKSVTWSSSNDKVVTVNSYGNITAVAKGTATITATTVDGKLTASCTVTVESAPLYNLDITVVGNGSALTSPIGTSFPKGTEVTVVANPAEGYEFAGWSGALTSGAESIVVTVDSDIALTATFTKVEEEPTPDPDPTPDPTEGDYTVITLPFSFDGAGTYKWVTTGDITSINSWNAASITVNGVDYTNRWADDFPAKQDGKYYIEYTSNVAWSHVEIKGVNGDPVSGTDPVTDPSTDPVAATPISLDYTYDGVGEFTWVTTDDINYISIWNLEEFTINGVSFDQWSNQIPAKQNGKYYITYKSSLRWGHAQIVGGLKSVTGVSADAGASVKLLPNPASDYVRVAGLVNAKSIELLSETGRKFKQVEVSNQSSISIPLVGCENGVCLVVITYNNGEKSTKKLLIK